MSRNLPVFLGGMRVITVIDAIAGLGGATMTVAGIKMIFNTGKVVNGQDELKKAFAEHRQESKLANTRIHDKLDTHNDRITVLEVIQGLTGSRPRIARRSKAQLVRDVEALANGEEP